MVHGLRPAASGRVRKRLAPAGGLGRPKANRQKGYKGRSSAVHTPTLTRQVPSENLKRTFQALPGDGWRCARDTPRAIRRPCPSPMHHPPPPPLYVAHRERRGLGPARPAAEGIAGASRTLMPAAGSGRQPPVVHRRDRRLAEGRHADGVASTIPTAPAHPRAVRRPSPPV